MVDTFCAIILVGGMYVMDCVKFADLGHEPMTVYECSDFAEQARKKASYYDSENNRHVLRTNEGFWFGSYCGDPNE